jgi:tetratricopeptide (TPR) repeat protein
MNNLAMAYQEAERLDDAVPLIEETLKKTLAKLGDRHPTTIVTMQNLATAYRSSDRPEDALPLFEQVVTAAVDVLGTDHPYTPTFMKSLAEAYANDGHPEKVVSMYEKAGMEKEAAEWREKISKGASEAAAPNQPAPEP